MGPRKLFTSSAHNGCVCPHSGYVCFFIGGTLDKHGAIESCVPVGCYRGIDTHNGFVCSHSGCLCCEKEKGGGPGNHGALKVVFQ